MEKEISLVTINPETGERSMPEETTEVLRRAFGLEQAVATMANNTADMEQRNLFGGLDKLQIFGVPIGQALGGGTVALLTSEALEAALPDDSNNVMRGLIKLLAGGAMVQFMSGLVGRGLSRTAALFLAFDATRDIIPLDQWIRDLIGAVTPGGASQPKTPVRQYDTPPANGDMLDQQLEGLLSTIR